MQGVKPAPSRLHSKVTVASLSLNANDAPLSVVPSGGYESIVGLGTLIVQLYAAAVLVPPAFVACTWNLWAAYLRPE